MVETNTYAELLVYELSTHLGDKFKYGASGPYEFDAPGLITRCLRVPRLIDGEVDFGAYALMELCEEISVEEASQTRGAFLYYPGFIAVSLGDGKCICADPFHREVVVERIKNQFTIGGILTDFLIPYEDFIKKDAAIPYGWKDTSSPVQGIVSNKFSVMHQGIDIDCKAGSPVYSIFSGVVVKQGWNVLKDRSGYGILIRSDLGLEYQYYGHLSRIKVNVGDSVKHGQLIAYSGLTGYTDHPYLHLETWSDRQIPYDPMELFKMTEVTPGTIYGQRTKYSNTRDSYLPLVADGVEGYRTLTEEARFLKERGYLDKIVDHQVAFRTKDLITGWQRFLYDAGYYKGLIEGNDSRELLDAEEAYYDSLGIPSNPNSLGSMFDVIRKRQEFLCRRYLIE